jgi:RNase P subunit RPR2
MTKKAIWERAICDKCKRNVAVTPNTRIRTHGDPDDDYAECEYSGRQAWLYSSPLELVEVQQGLGVKQ